MSIVHLQVDALHGLLPVRVNLLKTFNLEVFVLELESCDLWRHWLIVLFVEVFDLKWGKNSLLLVVGITEGASTLEFLLCELLFFNFRFFPSTVPHEAEAAWKLFAVGAGHYLLEPEAEECKEEECYEHHYEAS